MLPTVQRPKVNFSEDLRDGEAFLAMTEFLRWDLGKGSMMRETGGASQGGPGVRRGLGVAAFSGSVSFRGERRPTSSGPIAGALVEGFQCHDRSAFSRSQRGHVP